MGLLKRIRTKQAPMKHMSPAGRKFLKRKKEIESTRLSVPSKKQLRSLSTSDYTEVMNILKRKKR